LIYLQLKKKKNPQNKVYVKNKTSSFCVCAVHY